MKTEYGKSDSLDTALATVVAANRQAQQASGVGGDIDIGVVGKTGEGRLYSTFVDEEKVKKLEEREKRIAKHQQDTRDEVLDEEEIEWNPEP